MKIVEAECIVIVNWKFFLCPFSYQHFLDSLFCVMTADCLYTAVNNLPMGYPVLPPPPIPAPGQPHLDSMSHGISSCHVVNGVPAPSNFQPMRMNSGNECVSLL